MKINSNANSTSAYAPGLLILAATVTPVELLNFKPAQHGDSILLTIDANPANAFGAGLTYTLAVDGWEIILSSDQLAPLGSPVVIPCVVSPSSNVVLTATNGTGADVTVTAVVKTGSNIPTTGGR